jgi:hypothetical protein
MSVQQQQAGADHHMQVDAITVAGPLSWEPRVMPSRVKP